MGRGSNDGHLGVKARLIVQSKITTPWPQTVCFLPPEDPIPNGWEELEIVTEVQPRSESNDLCICQHTRSLHLSHSEACLKLECPCKQFEEAA